MSNKKPNFVAMAKEARAAAKEAIGLARSRYPNDYHVHREAEIVWLNENGERSDADIDFIEVRKLSGSALREIVESHAKGNAGYFGFALQGGVDSYESLRGFVDGDWHDPNTETWDGPEFRV